MVSRARGTGVFGHTCICMHAYAENAQPGNQHSRRSSQSEGCLHGKVAISQALHTKGRPQRITHTCTLAVPLSSPRQYSRLAHAIV
jgi:hypothetical protein